MCVCVCEQLARTCRQTVPRLGELDITIQHRARVCVRVCMYALISIIDHPFCLRVCRSAEDLSPDFRKVRILVNHDGHVHWEPGGVFTTTCDIDIRYFPFDDQNCPIQIGAWAYYR